MGRRNEKSGNKRKGAGKLALGLFLIIAAAGLIAASSLFRFDEWREFDPSLILDCPQALRIYDTEGKEVLVTGAEKRIWVKLSELSETTKYAFVSAEDARFYTHRGLDLYRICGAAWADIKAGGFVQGASTISQQLIKLSHLSSEKTIDRKLEEAALAAALERNYGKDEIMEMYLNYIYFGGGFYGIEAASLGYFGVHASELTAAQAAQLAGILKSPSAYAPHLDLEASLARRDTVLRLMNEYGYLSEEEYTAAKAEEFVLENALPSEQNAVITRAISEAEEATGLSREELLTGGYSIFTTLESGAQAECEALFAEGALFPSENAQGALVLLNAEGGIAAMITGRDEYDPSGLDRAAGVERQPGSLIKPVIVYAPALEAGLIDASTVFLDEPTSFGDWTPRNSDDKYYGFVTLREAVSRSLNVPAVKTLESLGVMNAVSFAERLGISFENEEQGLPLALGGFTRGVSPLEITGAYSAFSRGGLYTEPYCVTKITDASGKTVYERGRTYERVMSAENAYVLTSLLMTAAETGTAKRLAELELPIAAKTGTVVDDNGVRDAWCAAYTRGYTAVVRIGTDSANEGSLPENAVGGNHPTIILKKLFSFLYKGKTCEDFAVPKGVEEVTLDLSELENGKVYSASAGTPEEMRQKEYFVRGAFSLGSSPNYAAPYAPDGLGFGFDENGSPVISFIAAPNFTYKILRSDMSGEEITVFGPAEGSGVMSFADEGCDPGGIYAYRVIVENPMLTDENGEPLYAAESRKLRVVAPFYQ